MPNNARRSIHVVEQGDIGRSFALLGIDQTAYEARRSI